MAVRDSVGGAEEMLEHFETDDGVEAAFVERQRRIGCVADGF
jgi:translation elongation factor EF-1beta